MSVPAWGQNKPAAPPAPSGAATLSLDQINAAVKAGKAALYRIEPEYTFRDEYYLRGHSRNSASHQSIFHESGNHALAVWALLASGESYQNPPLFKRMSWVLSTDPPYVYDRGMRAQMLAELPRSRWAPWVKRDFLWLTAAINENGNFSYEWYGKKLNEWGDHANGQYGVLGLWGCERAGFPVRAQTWALVDQHWRTTQLKDGGWSVRDPAGKNELKFFTRSAGPMTAGGVATLTLTERYLFGDKRLDPGDNVSLELRKGLRWLDTNFKLDDPAEESDLFFYMWTIQRVGHASGYRTFNGVDWYRDVTAELLRRQARDGSWSGQKGVLLSTGFAMLYLSRANDPLAIAKLRLPYEQFSGAPGIAPAAAAPAADAKQPAEQPLAPEPWNNRPNDVWNFVDYLSDQIEYGTTWQIFEPDQPAYALVEAPVLYLSTDRAFKLTDQQLENLRGFAYTGGILVTNPDANKPEAGKAFHDLAQQLFPGRKLEDVPKDHELYTMHQQVPPRVNMAMVSNGLRPLMIHFKQDIGRSLQANDQRNPDSFVALSNIYLYATGMYPRRARLENNYVVQKNLAPTTVVKAARIKHSGNFDPEPGALPQIKALAANELNIDLQLSTVSPRELGDHQLAFLTTVGDKPLDASEAAAIRSWLNAGGTLWLDAAGGSRDASMVAEQMLGQILPDSPTLPLDREDPILTGEGLPGGYNNRFVRYRLYALHRIAVNRPRLLAAEVGGRQAVIFSSEDLTCGWAGLDHWNIFGYSSESARKLLLNGIQAMLKPQPRRTSPAVSPSAEPAPAQDADSSTPAPTG